jgi:hypothetical protein
MVTENIENRLRTTKNKKKPAVRRCGKTKKCRKAGKKIIKKIIKKNKNKNKNKTKYFVHSYIRIIKLIKLIKKRIIFKP